jgi:nitrite reductase/ring-hydroxylating ferredoxin subunit
LNDSFIRAIKTDEVAAGGMKAVVVNGLEIVVCNCGGTFYAVDRRCGHMNAPLEMGTLDGSILTCAMHCAQFDVITGESVSGPVPPHLGGEVAPPRLGAFLRNVGMLMQHVRTESIGVHKTTVEDGWVLVAEARVARS